VVVSVDACRVGVASVVCGGGVGAAGESLLRAVLASVWCGGGLVVTAVARHRWWLVVTGLGLGCGWWWVSVARVVGVCRGGSVARGWVEA
jgi:hypothetical protein